VQSKSSDQRAHQMLMVERRLLVADLLKSGLSQRKILVALQGQRDPKDPSLPLHKISLGTVNSDIKAIMAELTKVSVNRVQEARELDLARIDQMLVGLWPGASSGDAEKVRAATPLLARRAKMLGYDEPTKVVHGGDSEAAPIQIVYRTGPKIDLTQLSDEQLEQLENIVQHQVAEEPGQPPSELE